jgi:ribosomal-protein-alanine N-acetyltransferase
VNSTELAFPGSLPMLETKRLALRAMSLADAPAMFEYASDPEVTKYVSWPQHSSSSDSERFLRTVIESYKTNCPSGWGIVLKESNAFIGTIGMVCSWKRGNYTLEIGYCMNRRNWGYGLATEAAQAVVECLFRQTSVNRIEAQCHCENIASARVLEKCGMQLEGILRNYLFYKGKFRDLRLYSILRHDFLETKK